MTFTFSVLSNLRSWLVQCTMEGNIGDMCQFATKFTDLDVCEN